MQGEPCTIQTCSCSICDCSSSNLASLSARSRSADTWARRCYGSVFVSQTFARRTRKANLVKGGNLLFVGNALSAESVNFEPNRRLRLSCGSCLSLSRRCYMEKALLRYPTGLDRPVSIARRRSSSEAVREALISRSALFVTRFWSERARALLRASSSSAATPFARERASRSERAIVAAREASRSREAASS